MKKLLGIIKPSGIRELLLALFAWVHFLFIDILVVSSLFFWFHGTVASVVTPEGNYSFWLPAILRELSVNYPGSASLFIFAALLAVVLMLFLSLYINGGMYSALRDRTAYRPFDQVKRSARFFGPMLRLAVTSVPLWLILALLPGILLKMQVTGQETSPSEGRFYLFAALWTPLTLFFIMVGKSVFDYARVHLVGGETGVIRSLKEGFLSLWRNRLMTLGLFLIYFIFTALVLFLFGLPGAGLPLVALLLIHQASVLVRYWGRVLLIKGQVTLLLAGESKDEETGDKEK